MEYIEPQRQGDTEEHRGVFLKQKQRTERIASD